MKYRQAFGQFRKTVEITKILKQNDKLKKENVLHTQWVIPETNII